MEYQEIVKKYEETKSFSETLKISCRAGSLESEKTLNQNINSKTQISSRMSRFIRDGAIRYKTKLREQI